LKGKRLKAPHDALFCEAQKGLLMPLTDLKKIFNFFKDVLVLGKKKLYFLIYCFARKERRKKKPLLFSEVWLTSVRC